MNILKTHKNAMNQSNFESCNKKISVTTTNIRNLDYIYKIFVTSFRIGYKY